MPEFIITKKLKVLGSTDYKAKFELFLAIILSSHSRFEANNLL